MLFRKNFLLSLIAISISGFASAQQDSVKKDTTQLYRDIESYSKRSSFNGFLYRLIFKPVTPDSKKKPRKKAYNYVPVNLKYRTQDFRAGKALQLFKGSTEDELVTNLILAARYMNIRYFEKPSELLDPFHNYSSENFYLATVGISTRRYVQDRYIFKYGVTEDVPVGSVYSLTGGYQVKNN